MPELQSEKILKAYKAAGYNSKYLAADQHKLFEDILVALVDSPSQDNAMIRASLGMQKSNLLFEKKCFELSLVTLKK